MPRVAAELRLKLNTILRFELTMGTRPLLCGYAKGTLEGMRLSPKYMLSQAGRVSAGGQHRGLLTKCSC